MPNKRNNLLRTFKVGWFVHLSFILIISFQIALVILFYNGSIITLFSKPELEYYNYNVIKSLDRDSGDKYLRQFAELQRASPGLSYYRHRLVPMRLPILPSLKAEENWDGLKYCRTKFETNGAPYFDSCVGFSDNVRVGYFLYIHVATSASVRPRTTDTDLLRSDHIRFALWDGDESRNFIIANSQSGQVIIPTIYSVDDRWGHPSRPTPDEICLIKKGSAIPAPGTITHYLCRIPIPKTDIFKGEAKPYSAALLTHSRPRIAIFTADQKGGLARQVAASYTGLPGAYRDLDGMPYESVWDALPTLLTPTHEQRSYLKLCIADGKMTLLSNQGPCAGATVDPNASDMAGPRFSGGGLSSTLRFDRYAYFAQWFATNQRLVWLFLTFVLSTIAIYVTIVVFVLRPIRDISNQVRKIDISRDEYVRYHTRISEISFLARSYNALIFNARSSFRNQYGFVVRQYDGLRRLRHDISTPIVILANKMPESDDLYRQIRHLEAAMQRFGDLPDPHDAFSCEMENVVLERTDLSRLLQRIVAEQSAIPHEGLGHSVTFELTIPHGPIVGDVSALHLTEALLHILNNARYYAAIARHRAPVSIGMQLERNRVVISVRNAGPHIAEKDKARIFDLGFSTKPDNKTNIGQGLFAARTFVTRMGGDLRAENVEDGVCFFIELPNPVGGASE